MYQPTFIKWRALLYNQVEPNPTFYITGEAYPAKIPIATNPEQGNGWFEDLFRLQWNFASLSCILPQILFRMMVGAELDLFNLG